MLYYDRGGVGCLVEFSPIWLVTDRSCVSLQAVNITQESKPCVSICPSSSVNLIYPALFHLKSN